MSLDYSPSNQQPGVNIPEEMQVKVHGLELRNPISGPGLVLVSNLVAARIHEELIMASVLKFYLAQPIW